MAPGLPLVAAVWLAAFCAPGGPSVGASHSEGRGAELAYAEPGSLRSLLQSPQTVPAGTPAPSPDEASSRQQPTGQAALLVHVETSVVTVATEQLSLKVILERRPPGSGAWGSEGWAKWASSQDREIAISAAAFLSPQTLAGVSERVGTQESPTEGNPLRTVAFTELFENLPDGEYRALIGDLTTCNPGAGCAIIAYSTPHLIANSSGFGQNVLRLGIAYGAIELGLRFTRCANGTACFDAAAGVQVVRSTTDAGGVTFPAASGEGLVEVDRDGYALLGAYMGLRHTLRFHTGLYDEDIVRQDVSIDEQTEVSSQGFVNIGVLDVTAKDIMCSPSGLGLPAQQLVTGGLQGTLPSSTTALYTPGLQCYWQIVPDQPVDSITITLLDSGTGLGAGTELKIFSILPANEIQLVHTVTGFTQQPIIVFGSQVLLLFSSQSYSPMGTGFQLAWTAEAAEAAEDTWFDSRTATILFSSLAGVAYITAALAAVKWWRQRSQLREEEANRQALRDAQRAARRRNRVDTRRRRHRGLPVELVSRLPTSTIQLADFEREGEEEPCCSICLCEYEDGEKVTWLPCSHNYHTTCVSSWLKNSLICPICKDNVKRSLLKTLSMYRELHRSGASEGIQLSTFSTAHPAGRAALGRAEAVQDSAATGSLPVEAQLSGDESDTEVPHSAPAAGSAGGQQNSGTVYGAPGTRFGGTDNRV